MEVINTNARRGCPCRQRFRCQLSSAEHIFLAWNPFFKPNFENAATTAARRVVVRINFLLTRVQEIEYTGNGLWRSGAGRYLCQIIFLLSIIIFFLLFFFTNPLWPGKGANTSVDLIRRSLESQFYSLLLYRAKSKGSQAICSRWKRNSQVDNHRRVKPFEIKEPSYGKNHSRTTLGS